jgi:hypothetical protein
LIHFLVKTIILGRLRALGGVFSLVPVVLVPVPYCNPGYGGPEGAADGEDSEHLADSDSIMGIGMRRDPEHYLDLINKINQSTKCNVKLPEIGQ